MLIEKIEKLKNNKYNIYINGEKITTYDNIILENNILYKKQIDNDLYHIGASLKDLGKKCFAINKIENIDSFNKLCELINKS